MYIAVNLHIHLFMIYIKKNPNMHFIVNNDTALVVVRKRFSLPEHLHDCGFNNVTVV